MKQGLHKLLWRSMSAMGMCCLSFLTSQAQNTESTSQFEIGITVGPSNFLGDLGGNRGKGTTFLKDNNFPLTKFIYGAYLSYQPKEWLALRLQVSRGRLEGDDQIIKDNGGLELARKTRNSDFRSSLTEGFLGVEIYPTVFIESDPADVWMKIRPYGLIGVGVFHFNPQGTDPLTGRWVDLKPLHTEGQGFREYPNRKEYNLTQLNVPLGVGAKFFLSETVNLGLEIVHRKTFTDYIDDVSTTYIDPGLFYNYLPIAQADLAARMANKTNGQFKPGDKRGTASNNDAYFSVNVRLGIRLGSSNRYGSSMRCPVRF